MIRLVTGLGTAILISTLLQAQTEQYELFKRQQQSQTQEATSPGDSSPNASPNDCVDCEPNEEQDSQQAAVPDFNSTPGDSDTPRIPRNRGPNLTYGRKSTNSREMDRNRDERGFENAKSATSTPRIKETPTEFQLFVQSSTGRLLPIFGSALFDRVPSTFAPADRLPAKADYLVGPGDEIELKVWGQVNFSDRLTVDVAGDIFLPQVGRISVSGLRFAQLRDALHSALGRIYRNFDLNVNMGQLRSMQIIVLGQARRPGAYTVSSLSTLVNALFASGGPSSRGSLRDIQVKRAGKVVTHLDLYDLLLQGDQTKDIPLLAGDIIFIPDSGPRVAVDGTIDSPAIYELKPDTTLGDLLGYAGGLSSVAAGQRAIVERIDDHSALHSEDVKLNPAGFTARPQDGDIIRVLPVVPRFQRTVSLRGNVADSIRMAWRPGMKISDLIPNREALLTRGYWRQHNELVNTGAVSYHEEVRSTSNDLSLAAATAKPNISTVREFTSATNIQPMAPDIDWNFATIERLNVQDLSTHLISFNLGKVVIDHDTSADVELEPGDVITVFSSADITVPRAEQTKYVRIEGEIKMAGVYSARPGETLRDLVARAGGFTQSAYLFGAQFTRESTRKEQQRRYSEYLDQLESQINQGAASLSGRALSAEQATTSQSTIASERALLANLRGAAATGRIVFDLQPDSIGVESLPKVPLENGDRLFVPAVPSTVNVVGMVYNQAAFLYASDLRLGDYLHDAGGPSRFADRSKVFVVRADGTVISRETRSRLFASNFDSLRMYPGDTLIMPPTVLKVTLLRSLLDWSQVIANFGLGAAAVNVLK